VLDSRLAKSDPQIKSCRPAIANCLNHACRRRRSCPAN